MLLAIDPGNVTGWAVFNGPQDQTLKGCGYGPPAALVGFRPDVLVIERPQVYDARHSKGDPNDLITLAITVGRLIERMDATTVLTPLPREWKKQLPKDICHKRALAVLSPDERRLLVSDHNALDAVALGLWYLKRWRP